MQLIELKAKYNKLLSREKRAQQFFQEVALDEIDIWLPKYNEIIVQLSMLISLYEKLTGKEMTKNEVFNGFHDVDMSPEAPLVTKEAK